MILSELIANVKAEKKRLLAEMAAEKEKDAGKKRKKKVTISKGADALVRTEMISTKMACHYIKYEQIVKKRFLLKCSKNLFWPRKEVAKCLSANNL